MEIKRINEGELFLALSLYLCCELVEGDNSEYVPLEEIINLKNWNFLYLYSYTKSTSRKRKIIKIESLVKHFSPRLFQLTPTYDNKETGDGAILIERIIKSGNTVDYDLELDPKNTYLSDVLRQYFVCFLNNTIESSPTEPQLQTERQLEIISAHVSSQLDRLKPIEVMVDEGKLIKSLSPEDKLEEFSETGSTLSFLEVFGTLHISGLITITDLYYRDHSDLVVNFKVNEPPSLWTIHETKQILSGKSQVEYSISEKRDFTYENSQLTLILDDGGPTSVNFQKAPQQLKVFEAFFYLWLEDGKSEHTPTEIVEYYKRRHRKDLLLSEIGERVGNIKAKIVGPAKSRIIWGYNRSTHLWKFQILPRHNQS